MRTRIHILLACLAFAVPLAVTAGAQAAGSTTIRPASRTGALVLVATRHR
jgi:hypothetical protein